MVREAITGTAGASAYPFGGLPTCELPPFAPVGGTSGHKYEPRQVTEFEDDEVSLVPEPLRFGSASKRQKHLYHNISAMTAYIQFSPEELRVMDYSIGRRTGSFHPTPAPRAKGFEQLEMEKEKKAALLDQEQKMKRDKEWATKIIRSTYRVDPFFANSSPKLPPADKRMDSPEWTRWRDPSQNRKTTVDVATSTIAAVSGYMGRRATLKTDLCGRLVETPRMVPQKRKWSALQHNKTNSRPTEHVHFASATEAGFQEPETVFPPEPYKQDFRNPPSFLDHQVSTWDKPPEGDEALRPSKRRRLSVMTIKNIFRAPYYYLRWFLGIDDQFFDARSA